MFSMDTNRKTKRVPAVPGKKPGNWLKIVLVAALYVLYIVAYPFLATIMGPGVTAMSLLPLLAAAVMFGFRIGLVAAVATIILNIAILLADGTVGFIDILQSGGLGGMLILLVVGPTVGWLSDMRKKLSGMVDEAKSLEKALRASETLYRNVFGNSPLSVILWDTNYHILDWNQRAEQVFGWTREEMLGESILSKLFLPEEADEFIKTIDWAGNDQPGVVFTSHNQTKEKGLITCEWRNTVAGDQHGLSVVMVSLGLDVTRRQYLEQQEHEQRQLAEAMTSIASLLSSSLALDEVLDQIFDNLSRVVPYESANLMLREGDFVRLVRKDGYAQEEPFMEHLPIAQLYYLNKMYETRQPVVVADIRNDPHWVVSDKFPLLRSYMGAPLLFRDTVIGFLNVDSTQVHFFDDTLIQRLKAFADQAAVAIENARLYEQAQEESLLDPLTQAYNRRGLYHLGEKELSNAKYQKRPLSLMMFDIDHFKAVNDQHGHAFGDEVLQTISSYCRDSLRRSDLVCRYGGDEFVILLPDCSLTIAIQRAERLRQRVMDHYSSNKDLPSSVTLSIGVAERNQTTTDLMTLIKAADKALYQAKDAGRNCVSS
jgi:diguanylate cyclase (GGDEF)-like protein/PAS domain S-box-containing protein